jgi:hypothetical protein
VNPTLMKVTVIARAKKERSKWHSLLGSMSRPLHGSDKILARQYTIKGKTPTRPQRVFLVQHSETVVRPTI